MFPTPPTMSIPPSLPAGLDELHPHLGDALLLLRCVRIQHHAVRSAMRLPVHGSVRLGIALRSRLRALAAKWSYVGGYRAEGCPVYSVLLLRLHSVSMQLLQHRHHAFLWIDDRHHGETTCPVVFIVSITYVATDGTPLVTVAVFRCQSVRPGLRVH